jgi:hypothetical protein
VSTAVVLVGSVPVDVDVGVPPGLSKRHQAKPKLPEKVQYRSFLPVAPETGQVTVLQLCVPPVDDMVQVATTVPVLLPRLAVSLPLPLELATRTESDEAPEPKSTPLTLIYAPLALVLVTSMKPSLYFSVLTPEENAIVVAEFWT